MTHHYDFGRFLTLLAMLGLTLTACETDNNHAFIPSTPDKDVKEMCLYVNGEHYDIALPAGEPVDLITLNTEFDADIQVKNASEFRQITVNGVALKDGVCSLPISKIALNEKIEIIYDTGSQLGTVHLNTVIKPQFVVFALGFQHKDVVALLGMECLTIDTHAILIVGHLFFVGVLGPHTSRQGNGKSNHQCQ